jgi:hypothetical protein
MKFLLTSGGVANTSIRDALVGLLGKPIGDSSALCIPTAEYGHHFPHLDHELMLGNTMAEAERWAADIAGPAYAIDDETAIRVADGTVEVVSEGRWRLFTHSLEATESV